MPHGDGSLARGKVRRRYIPYLQLASSAPFQSKGPKHVRLFVFDLLVFDYWPFPPPYFDIRRAASRPILIKPIIDTTKTACKHAKRGTANPLQTRQKRSPLLPSKRGRWRGLSKAVDGVQTRVLPSFSAYWDYWGWVAGNAAAITNDHSFRKQALYPKS